MMGLFSNKQTNKQSAQHSTANTSHTNAKSKSQRLLEQRQRLNRITYLSLYWLITLVAVTAVIDLIWFTNYIIVKSVALGAGLNWLAQAVFAKFVYRYLGVKARRHIVYQLYIGQMIKWVITLTGFALIFIKAHPLAPFAVLMGYFLMQVGQSVTLYRLK